MALKFRRGTTAQQSGSLAFGEPYVNTTLGTLLVGGQNGDIVLATSGTGSTGNFGAISGSGLDITGNANIGGNLTLGGNITIGNQTTDVVNVVANLSSSLIPSDDNVFDIGAISKRYKNVYASELSASHITVESTASAEIHLKNSINGTDYHIRNASGSGNFVIFNLGSGRPILLAASASATEGEDITLFADVLVTGSLTSKGEISGSSLNGIGNVSVYSASVESKIIALGVETSNLELFTSSINTTIKGQLDANTVVSGSSQVIGILGSLNSYTQSNDTTNNTQNSRLDQLSTASGSAIGRLNNLESTSASLLVETANLELFTASQETKNSTLATYTGSNDTKWNTLGSLSGSFARIDSANTFNGNQIVSGSLTVTQDFIVLGSSSITNVSSSTLNIGTNLITVAVNQPSVRFGGISVIDSGSSGGSGSFLYDSVQDEFIFVHRGNGTNVTSSHFVLGPETYDNLGNETYLTNNTVPKGTGKEHLNDSNITDTGTLITLGSDTVINGSLIATTITLISGSSQLTQSYDNRYETTGRGIISGSGQLGGIYETTGRGIISGSGQLTNYETTGRGIISGSGQLTNYETTGRGIISGSGQLTNYETTGRGIISGSGQLTNYETTGRGIISGSSQIANTSITNAQLVNSAITIAGTSTSLGGSITAATILQGTGVVSGSSQVSYTGLTGIPAGIISSSATVYSGVSGDITIASNGVATIAANSVALGTDTTGNYMSNVSAGNAGIVISHTPGEGSTATISLVGGVVSGSAQIDVSSTTGDIALGTRTSGNYVATITAGTGVSSTGATTGEGIAHTISIGQAVGTSDNVRFASIGVGMAATGTSGRIDAAGDVVAFSTSDIRFKENIKAIENPIQKIRQISGNTYDWKAELKDVHGFEGNDVGVIAQEVEAVLPQLVTTRDNGYKAVKYDKLVALLIEGMKEQQLQIEQLRIDLNNCKTNKGL